MRKAILLIALIVPLIAFGQVENVKKAMKSAKKMTPDFAEAESLINAALEDETTKNLSETWYTKGFIEFRKFEVQDDKRFEVPPGTPDINIQSEAAYKAFINWIVADSLDVVESVSDPKRKGKMAYRKDIVDVLNKMPLFINNYGSILFVNKDFASAKNVFEDIYKMPSLEMFKGSEKIKDTATVFVDAYENIQVCLRQIYIKQKTEKDSVAFLESLEEGTTRFPENEFFLTELIQYNIDMNREQEALNNINKAIQLDPKNYMFYYVRGFIYSFKKDKKAEAEADFFKAIEIKPDFGQAIYALGSLIFEKADFSYNRASVEIRDPNQAAEEMNKAKELYKQAIPYFEKARELNVQGTMDELLRKLKAAYYKLGMKDKAKEVEEARTK